MERVILVLAMLAGLHLLLSFFRSAAQALKSLLNRRTEAMAASEPVKVTSTHWQQYDRPAYQRRTGIDIDPAKSSEASFEVIA